MIFDSNMQVAIVCEELYYMIQNDLNLTCICLLIIFVVSAA